MKQSFKVRDQPLTNEIIDAIMAENGRDIEAAKRPFADYDTIKTQLTAARETIKGCEGQDIEGVKSLPRTGRPRTTRSLSQIRRNAASARRSTLFLEEAAAAAQGRHRTGPEIHQNQEPAGGTVLGPGVEGR